MIYQCYSYYLLIINVLNYVILHYMVVLVDYGVDLVSTYTSMMSTYTSMMSTYTPHDVDLHQHHEGSTPSPRRFTPL